ncbi:MAG: hypothetical protein HQL57_00845 [Magnetococcales bacterium]|nr:hypothetical protein [Magnetococcales bacterium]
MLPADAVKRDLFVQEARKRLAAASVDLGFLDGSHPLEVSHALERLLRTYRGVRGSSALLYLDRVTLLSELLETLVERLRQGSPEEFPSALAALATGTARLRSLVEDLDSVPTVGVEAEVEALRTAIEGFAPVVFGEFDLGPHRQGVAQAVAQGLELYRIDLPLGGDGAARKGKFDSLKEELSVVGSVIASLPDLGEELVWDAARSERQVSLLLATVLGQDLLMGLTRLPAGQVRSVPVPDGFLPALPEAGSEPAAEALEADSPEEKGGVSLGGEESPPLDAESGAAAPVPEAEADVLDEAALGETEEELRRAHFAELERERQTQEAEAERVRELERERQTRAELARAEESERRAREVRLRRLRRAAAGVLAASVLFGIYQLTTGGPEEGAGPIEQASVDPSASAGGSPSLDTASAGSSSVDSPSSGSSSESSLPPAVAERGVGGDDGSGGEAVVSPAVSPTVPTTPGKGIRTGGEATETVERPVEGSSSADPGDGAGPEEKVPPAGALAQAVHEGTPVVTGLAEPHRTGGVAVSSGTLVAPRVQDETILPPPSSGVPVSSVVSASADSGVSGSEGGAGMGREGDVVAKDSPSSTDIAPPPVKEVAAASTSGAKVSKVRSSRPPRPELVSFAQWLRPMNRLQSLPYLQLTPAKGSPAGRLLYSPGANGDLRFSVARLMGHTASRPGDTFVLSPETMKELRVVFQVDPGEAYMFPVEANGDATIPRTFWDRFSVLSRKAVTLSRVVADDERGLHLRDLVAVSVKSVRMRAVR